MTGVEPATLCLANEADPCTRPSDTIPCAKDRASALGLARLGWGRMAMRSGTHPVHTLRGHPRRRKRPGRSWRAVRACVLAMRDPGRHALPIHFTTAATGNRWSPRRRRRRGRCPQSVPEVISAARSERCVQGEFTPCTSAAFRGTDPRCPTAALHPPPAATRVSRDAPRCGTGRSTGPCQSRTGRCAVRIPCSTMPLPSATPRIR